MEQFGYEVLIPVVALTGVFALAVVAIWSSQKRREREAYYRHELAKQVVARGGDPEELTRVYAKQSTGETRRKLASVKLGGIVLLSIGVSVIGLLWTIVPEVWAAGLPPTLLGLALIAWAVISEPDANDD
jgi:hypothetical protein